MFFQVLWPSLVSALSLSVANMADAVAVGNRMGESGLAAIGLVTPLYMIYNVIGLAFSSGGCVTHSRLAADGQDEKALAVFRTLSLWLLGLSLAIAVLGNVFMNSMLTVLGAGSDRAELQALCQQYGRPLIAAAPIMLFNLLLYDFVRCDNGAALATLGFSVGSILDLVLNLVFVLLFGWGVAGSAWATVLAQTVSVVIMALHLVRGNGLLRLKAFRGLERSKEITILALRSVQLGLTTSLRYVFQFLFLTIGNRLLLQAGKRGEINGEIYVAMFDVVINISYLIYGLYQAFSDTMQPLATTFSAEHDKEDLRYLRSLALRCGLLLGIVMAGAVALLSVPLAQLFGMRQADGLTVAARAIPIFCLSTPFAGYLIIMTGYYQSTDQGLMAGLATIFRTLIFLIPVTTAAGWLFPGDFWWLFLFSELGSLAAMLLADLFIGRRLRRKLADVPVYSAVMDNDNHELARVLDGATAFCEEREIPIKQATLIQLAVEELCLVTIQQAFTGAKGEYIQLTLVETGEGYILHIRNSAPYFNPLDMRMERLSAESQEELLDSVGVMMVRKRAKSLRYRNYQGFNVMTVQF